MTKNLRLHWDSEIGWILDVPILLPDHVVSSSIKWAIPLQVDRYRSLPIGDKKDELKKAIKLLIQGKVQQRIVGYHGDGKGDLVIYGGV